MKRLLLVEDDEKFGSILASILKKSYHIQIVSTIKEAIEKIIFEDIDYICCDYHLPDGNALELLESIRNGKICIPTVIMSADLDRSIRRDAKLYGVVDVLEKSDSEFLSKLKILLMPDA